MTNKEIMLLPCQLGIKSWFHKHELDPRHVLCSINSDSCLELAINQVSFLLAIIWTCPDSNMKGVKIRLKVSTQSKPNDDT